MIEKNETNQILYDLELGRVYFQYDNLLNKIIRLQEEQSVLDMISMRFQVFDKKAKYKEISIDAFNLFRNDFIENWTTDGNPFIFMGPDSLEYYPRLKNIVMEALLILDPDYECKFHKGTEYEAYAPTNYYVHAKVGQ